jgi:pimeloyl-ACP methyl ester carboxylesterase
MAEAVERVTQLPNDPRLPQERRVRANGIELCYLEWAGPPATHRPPVVLLHGILQQGAGMANLGAHLARWTRVIAPDLRGRGGSEQPTDGYNPGTMADDVAGLIREIGLAPPVVIGRMHGGLVAYHLAARHPDLISGLVVGDTAPEVNEARAARRIELARTIPPTFANRDEATAYYRDTLGLSQERTRHDMPSDLVEQEDGSLRWRYNLDVVEKIAAAAVPRSDWDVLAKITCPTLFVRGQRGDIPQEMVDRLRETMTNARLRVETVIGARHDVFLGPGTEQTFAAVDLFLMGLSNGQNGLTAQLPLAGAEGIASPRPEATPGEIVERIVRAINSWDPSVIDDLFDSNCKIRQYAEGGLVREGGIDAVRNAFESIFEVEPSAASEALDVVAGAGNRIAFVLSIQRPPDAPAEVPPVHAPIFLTLNGDRISEFTAYRVRLGTPSS